MARSALLIACLSLAACERRGPLVSNSRDPARYALLPARSPTARDAAADRPARDASPDVAADRPGLVYPPGDGGACTTDEDCPGQERCFNENLEAQYSRVFHDCEVARTWRAAHRRGTCVPPACTEDSHCPAGQRCGHTSMVPFPQRVCVPSTCRWDVQCRRGSLLGQCAPYLAGRPCEHGGWHCSFPDDPCSPVLPARRCRPVEGAIAYCIPVDGRFRCVTEDTP